MENPSDSISLYELVSCIDDVEIPPEFESELLNYILGLTDGTLVARMISQIFKDRNYSKIDEFIDALESHILEVMHDSFEVMNSEMVTAKKMTLMRLIIYYIYN